MACKALWKWKVLCKLLSIINGLFCGQKTCVFQWSWMVSMVQTQAGQEGLDKKQPNDHPGCLIDQQPILRKTQKPNKAGTIASSTETAREGFDGIKRPLSAQLAATSWARINVLDVYTVSLRQGASLASMLKPTSELQVESCHHLVPRSVPLLPLAKQLPVHRLMRPTSILK